MSGVIHIIQGSDEWFSARLGKVTGSRIADLMAQTKSGPSASRKNYLAQLVCERLTGEREETFKSAAMIHGTETEPQARSAYEFMHDSEVTEVGFVDHPGIEMSGCSPDGLVGDRGMIEIKCPMSATHIETLLTGKIDGKYLKQMQWNMACADREWCDFVSFDPRLPAEMQLWTYRVSRDAEAAAEIEEAVASFLAELDQTVAALRAKFMEAA